MKYISLFASLFLLCLPTFAHAASGSILISEVAWAGSSFSNADEWLELVNMSDEDMTLSGWSLDGAGTGGSALFFPEGMTISASSTFVIANYPVDHENSALLHEPNWTTTAVALSNSALELVLRDAEGVVIDIAGDGESPPAGNSGEVRASMRRVFGSESETAPWETSTISEGFKTGVVDLGTPGSFTFSPASESSDSETPSEVVPEIPIIEAPPRLAIPDPIITAIRISEVYPAPLTGEKEWIELVNTGSVGEFLDGWTIEDEKGGVTSLSGLVLPWGRVVITSPKGTLNNSGDIVLLKDVKGRIIDGMTYGASTLGGFPHAPKLSRGEALIRPEFGERFVTTSTPTPGEPNIEDALPVPVVLPAEPEQKPTSPVVGTPLKTYVPAPPVLAPIAALSVSAPTQKLTQTAPIKSKTTPQAKTASSLSRYKGTLYRATIAVPPGVYGKTRMRVIVDEELRELHLTKSPANELHAGEHILFVAQEKDEAGSAFLLANIKSLRLVDAGTPFEFLETDTWPESFGAYRLQGEVRSVDGTHLRLEMSGAEGVVHAPKSLSSRGIKEGDRVEVLGFFSPGTIPEMVMPYEEALTSLEPFVLETEETPSIPRWIGIMLLVLVIAGGALFHLYQERSRLLMTDSPL